MGCGHDRLVEWSSGYRTPRGHARNSAVLSLTRELCGPLAVLLSSAHAQSRGERLLGWRSFEVPDHPISSRHLHFTSVGNAEKGVGERFENADGRAVLSIYSFPNEAGDTPTSYLRENLRTKRSALDYMRVTPSFFAISSEGGGVILYSRCNFSRRSRSAIHCFDLKYPQEEKRSWDAIVTRMSLSLRPLVG